MRNPAGRVSHQRGVEAINSYYVQGSDGQFYGPADLPTLNEWAAQGRILADTVLVDASTNQQTSARNVSGLAHHFQLAPRPTQTTSAPTHQSWQHPPQPGNVSPSPYPYQVGPHGRGERKSKLVAALLAFFLGVLGIHRFYLGYQLIGVFMIVITVVGTCTCGIGFLVTAVWALIDFVLILMNQLPDSDGQTLD